MTTTPDEDLITVQQFVKLYRGELAAFQANWMEGRKLFPEEYPRKRPAYYWEHEFAEFIDGAGGDVILAVRAP